MRLFEGWNEAIAALGLEPWRGGRRRPWTDERIERELRGLLGDGMVFPTRAELERAGRGSLHQAIAARGGSTLWAARLGVRTRSRTWDEAALRRQLETYTAGRTTLPSQRELRQAGRQDLLNAIRRPWRRRPLGGRARPRRRSPR